MVAKSANLRKTEKRDLIKHLTLSTESMRTEFRDRKHADRIPRLKVGVSLVVEVNVKVTTKRLDYYIEITNRERLCALTNGLKVGRGQL